MEEARVVAINNMEKNAIYDKERFDRNKSSIEKFNIGDYVLLQNEERRQHKLDPKYKGPFKVIGVLDGRIEKI